MLAVLSPARNVRPHNVSGAAPCRPLFADRAARLAQALATYSSWELESLLEVPPERALALSDGYRRFDPAAPGTAALPSYYGAAFRNMELGDFTAEDFAFAQEHLRILSAFYGVLRPADGIAPHRLGLSRRFRVDGGDLYAFWGDAVYRALYGESRLVVNLASMDYARLIAPFRRPGDTMITCRFLVRKPGGARGTAATVRAARGRMARFIVKRRVTDPEGLKAFDWDGYQYIPGHSDSQNYVFIRDGLWVG